VDWDKLLESAVQRHISAIEAIPSQLKSLVDIYKLIERTYISDRMLYIAGNGGSAADAQHIAAELVGRFKRERRGLPAAALTTDTSCLTAIGNDYSFEDVFARQIEAQFRHGDMLWLLSVSGSSPNIVKAAQVAKQMGGYVVLFTGEKCSDLLKVVDAAFVAPATSSDTVQECHEFAYHLICDWVESSLS
jgi:D-sedoheptulose 7-phosphate isomerase